MPTSVEIFDCVDYAVLWESAGVDAYGVVKILEPVEIYCRWNDGKNNTQNAQSTQIGDPVRLCALQFIPMESLLWHGRLADLPAEPTELRQVKTDYSSLDVNGICDRFEFGMTRFMDKLPVFSPGTGS